MSLIASLWTFGTLCSVDVTSQAATAVCPETILTTNRTKLACTGISIRVISFRTAYLAFASSLESEIRSNTSSNTSRWQIIPIIPDGQSRTTLNTLPIMHEQTQLARSAVKCSLTWYARWGTSLASMFGNIFKESELTTRGTGLWESISKSRMSTIYDILYCYFSHNVFSGSLYSSRMEQLDRMYCIPGHLHSQTGEQGIRRYIS